MSTLARSTATTADQASPFAPEPGSLCDRILQLLAPNPEDSYTEHDLQLKFEVTNRAAVGQMLVRPRSLGLVQQELGGPVVAWCAGPKMAAWRAARQTAAPTAAAKPATRRGPPPAAERLDPLKVAVFQDVPMPVATCGRAAGVSPYAAVFARMKPGNMVPLSEKHAKGFSSWAKKNAPQQLATRRLLEPIDGLPMGAWRLDPPPAVAAEKAAKPASKSATK